MLTSSPNQTKAGLAEAERTLTDLSESELLGEAAEAAALARELEVHRLRIGYQWAVSHPAIDAVDTVGGAALPGVLGEPDTLGGPGTPPVAAFTAEALSVACGCSPFEASSMMADALDLTHRLPLLNDQVQAGMVPVWKARRLARRTRELSLDAAGWVDRQLAGRVSSIGPAMLDRLIAEAIARCDGYALADRERRAATAWDVVLSHPGDLAATSHLHATGDTLDLTRFHDLICAEAETLALLGDTNDLGPRKARALGIIANQQAQLDLTTLLDPEHSVNPEHSVDPEHVDLRDSALDRRASKTRLYLHASLADLLNPTPRQPAGQPPGQDQAVGSVESLGPATVALIKDWVGRSRVTIQPVLHVAAEDRWSVDRHDPPPQMAETVRLRDEHCVFPWCTQPARHCDLDHIHPYTDDDSPPDGNPPDGNPTGGSPPGQTTPTNLAPLCRRHHRAKTSRRWHYQRLDPGHYLWHSPSGTTTLVTQQGTVALPQ